MKALPKSLFLFFIPLLFCTTPKTESGDSSKQSTLQESGTPPIQDPKNVVDYYKLLSWKGLVDPYVFFQKDAKWLCSEDRGEDFNYRDSLNKVRLYPAVVDIKNGYLQIEDEGTGGGTYYQEVALFGKSDKSFLVAVNGYGVDPYGNQGLKPKFYVWQANTFNEVTNEVFPETLLPKGTQFRFNLPQIGRTINCYFLSADSTENKIGIQFDSSSNKFVVGQ